ncbi:transcription factor IIIA-like isoform X2 [Cryptotermes secundus]|uniref:transcription factor IIIA-like isoform X2 n=1 Tax=Cryptotermes secundus TaxID=105785 RepID=UPI000CD7B7A0|nr:transcription factor IIIA-like isoform X2 [Cryptotermes secundus]
MAASEEPKEDNMMLLISDNVVRKEDSQIRKIHSCPYKYCERSFNRPWRLASHVRSHTGQRSHPCEVPGCKKAYFNSSHLRRHMTTSHRAESLLKTLLKCPHPSCIVELSSSCSLKRHCWRIHERQHLFTCTNCDRGFSRQSQWQAHLYEHTGVPPFMCSTCQLGFINQRDFNRHNRRHAKNYLCEVSDCGKHFECYTHLLRHTTLHHPTEFVCDVCNKSFKAKCRLLTHMSVHQESSQREMLSCPYSNCARSYYHKRNLVYHIGVSHKGKRRNHRQSAKNVITQNKGRHLEGNDTCEKKPLVVSKTDLHDSISYVSMYTLKNSSCFGVSADGNASDGEDNKIMIKVEPALYSDTLQSSSYGQIQQEEQSVLHAVKTEALHGMESEGPLLAADTLVLKTETLVSSHFICIAE